MREGKKKYENISEAAGCHGDGFVRSTASRQSQAPISTSQTPRIARPCYPFPVPKQSHYNLLRPFFFQLYRRSHKA